MYIYIWHMFVRSRCEGGFLIFLGTSREEPDINDKSQEHLILNCMTLIKKRPGTAIFFKENEECLVRSSGMAPNSSSTGSSRASKGRLPRWKKMKRGISFSGRRSVVGESVLRAGAGRCGPFRLFPRSVWLSGVAHHG